MTADAVIAEIDALLGPVEPKITKSERGQTWFRGQATEAREAKTRLLAAIRRLAPAGSAYVDQAYEVAESSGHDGALVVPLVGILRALRNDYADGYMRAIEELVHADLFADLLEMADELLSKGYKDPAAVIGGSVLEEHLRKLAIKHGLALTHPQGGPRTGGPLNDDLVKAGAYTALVQKRVVALLHVRNKAAHAEWDEYDASQVGDLLREVRDFAERFPA